MIENEKVLMITAKAYEHELAKDNEALQRAVQKGFRMLQIRNLIMQPDGDFKAFLARTLQVKPEEYQDYYDNFELEEDKNIRLQNKIMDDFGDFGDLEDREEFEDMDLDDVADCLIGPCEECAYFNDSDDCCEKPFCDYKRKGDGDE